MNPLRPITRDSQSKESAPQCVVSEGREADGILDLSRAIGRRPWLRGISMLRQIVKKMVLTDGDGALGRDRGGLLSHVVWRLRIDDCTLGMLGVCGWVRGWDLGLGCGGKCVSDADLKGEVRVTRRLRQGPDHTHQKVNPFTHLLNTPAKPDIQFRVRVQGLFTSPLKYAESA